MNVAVLVVDTLRLVELPVRAVVLVETREFGRIEQSENGLLNVVRKLGPYFNDAA